MSVLEWIATVAAVGSLLILVLTDRWGHLVGTHNWRVSRRIDRRRREMERSA